MPKLRMRDTTAHSDHGQLLAGEVYDLPEEVHAHLIKQNLAKSAHADTETYHERQAREANQPAPTADEEEAAPSNPQIAAQVQQAGTRAGDQENATFPQREPLNAPSSSAQPRTQPRGGGGR